MAKRTLPLRDLDLLAQVHDAVIVTDFNGIIHTWNPGAARVYGYAAPEVIGKNVKLLYFSEDADTMRRLSVEPLKGKDRHQVTLRTRRKDGTEMFVALRIAALRDSSGAVVGYVGCSNDITERKRTREELEQRVRERTAALRAIQERLEHLLLRAPGVLYSCEPHGDFAATFLSENVRSEFGYTPEDFLRDSRFWLERVHPEDRDRVLAHAAIGIREGQCVNEYRFRHADGSYRFVRDSMVAVKDSAGAAIELVGYMSDVTEEEQTREARREQERLHVLAQALLTAQEAERKRISLELHDDLNQRLAALILDLAMLERKPPASQDRLQGRLTALKNQVAGISDEVRRIALQLHSAGLEHFGLRAALEQECATISGRNGIKVAFRSKAAPDSLPHPVSLCLFRVAQECLRNIVKHSKATRATVTLEGEAGGVRLSVRDQGRGFDPQEARGKNGLGLISMHERVRQVNGTLVLDSSPGRGTRVEVRVTLEERS